MLEDIIFPLILLPALIFFARVADVTLGTLRIVFISQGRRKLAPLVGFLEILIWLTAMSQVFNNVTNAIYYVAYAGGFAMGNYIGLIIENKISLGLLSLQLIIRENAEAMVSILKDQGYSLTTMTAEDMNGFVKIVYLVIRRKNLPKTLEMIRENDPKAFISVEEVKSISNGNFPQVKRWEILKRRKMK